MKLIALLLSVLSSLALACEQGEKPNLIIAEDATASFPNHCTTYYVSVPNDYKNAILSSTVIRHGDNDDEKSFLLQAGPDYDDATRQFSTLCANSSWLNEATLRIFYTPKPNEDGSTSLCVDLYEYSNLNDYVRQGKAHNESINYAPSAPDALKRAGY